MNGEMVLWNEEGTRFMLVKDLRGMSVESHGEKFAVVAWGEVLEYFTIVERDTAEEAKEELYNVAQLMGVYCPFVQSEPKITDWTLATRKSFQYGG